MKTLRSGPNPIYPEIWLHSTARWIWSRDYSSSETNSKFQFWKTFSVDKIDEEWLLDIAADSNYRLHVNGLWVGDGPARGYPDSLFFDRHPISEYLHKGENILAVTVTHLGVDTFRYIHGPAGLLLGVFVDGQEAIVVSDTSWKSSRDSSLRVNVPRISCQLGFEEQVDLRTKTPLREPVTLSEREGDEVYPQLRDVGLLGRDKREFKRAVSNSQVQSITRKWTIHLREHFGTFPRGVNVHGFAGLLGIELEARGDDTLTICVLGPVQGLFVDGLPIEGSIDQDLRSYPLSLKAGSHWLAVAVCDQFDQVFELSVGVRGGFQTEWRSPVGDASSPWVSTGPLWKAIKDTNCPIATDGSWDKDVVSFPRHHLPKQVVDLVRQLSACKSAVEFVSASPRKVLPLSSAHLAEADVYFGIRTDEVICGRFDDDLSINPNLILRLDQRIILDLEDIINGYIRFEIESEDTSQVDAYCFEHLQEKDGNQIVQYLQLDGNSYRSSFRLTSPKGKHCFFSQQRRGFRYCLLVLRQGSSPVRITNISVIESLYQPKHKATFHCSESRLNEIFRISQRTLLLCMEDTFTDCPSYEQVFWIGDARNESLFSAVSFGSYDLNERCLRLAANSMRKLPMVASQCPSGWDVIIPSFSFLWVLSVWEYYWQSGRVGFLEEIFPAVATTLDTATKYCKDHGLFSAPTWNFMDWAPMDVSHDTAIHNSILLANALDVGAKMAAALGRHKQGHFYLEAKSKLILSVDRLWREDVQGYSDSIHSTGEVSAQVSQHNSMLALLFGQISDPKRRLAAVEACVSPQSHMTKAGSPFAMFFLLEALIKEGYSAQVLDKIRSFWGHMVDANSPTCWEMVFPSSAPFPTRSYCHGWSAAPVYVLPYVFFGIEVLEPGWKVVRLRPQNFGLKFVEAELCTPLGMLMLSQRILPNGKLDWEFQAPAGMRVLTDKTELVSEEN